MEETKLNFVLMGRTGQGKSATGNTILNSRVFKTSSSVDTVTKEANFSFSQFENYTLLVVDGPGFPDTEMDMSENLTSIAKNVENALAMCYGGIDSFLFVIKFGNRFTHEDEMSLEDLESIYGKELFKHLIVVMTSGDVFHYEMEYETPDKTFHDWCLEQEDSILYRACEGRFVLFNNRERDEEKKRAQVQELVQLAHDIQKRSGRYTSECFSKAKCEREKLILKMKAPRLNEEFQEKITSLVASLHELCAHPSDDANQKLRARVLELRKEIDQQDQGYNVLTEVKELMTKVEEELNKVEKRIANQRRREAGFLETFTRWFTR